MTDRINIYDEDYMYSNMNKVIREIAASFIILLAFINSVSATVELTDFFSDFTTSEVTTGISTL